MTDAVASFLLEKFDDMVTKELNLPDKIKKGIIKFKRELKMLTAFFEDTDARGQQRNQIQETILRQFREIGYDIEDVIDMFAYQNIRKKLNRYATRSRTDNQSIAVLMEQIDRDLENIEEMKKRYQDISSSSQQASTSNKNAENQGISSLYTSEVELVGIDKPWTALASWVRNHGQGYRVMFVVGMGGLGKTAVVKVVCEQLKEDFDCHVWLTASKSVTSQELLLTMFSELTHQTAATKIYSHAALSVDLINMLKYYLQDKRYLIVLDDLWSKDVWECVENAFPKDNRRSRVIITTRRGDIASSGREDSVDVYNLQALPFESSQELFYKRVFPQSGSRGPPEPGLRLWSENILKQCEGLPLGINEIGKILSNRGQSENELRKFHDSLQAELESSGQLSRITQSLLLSFEDLPYHLKSCFLYMSMFPENYPVKHTTLIRLWMAEGFIKEEIGKQPEDTGEEYINELMKRNLIQVRDLNFYGRPITYRVHNLMHKIVILKSKGENFCTIFTNPRDEVPEKTRRLSIQSDEFNMSEKIQPHTRTLFASNLNLKTPARINSSFKLLKILHLDGARVDTFPKGIKELLLLKYLCLSNTRIKIIPMSIDRLQLLETLNLKQTFVTALPSTLAKLEKLRHLLAHRNNFGCYMDFDAVQGIKIQVEVNKLRNLQKLSLVRADRDGKLIQELQQLTQLKKLGITNLPRDSGPVLCRTIQMLSNLQSLNVASCRREEVLVIQEITNPPILQHLYLKGCLEKMPNWISKLHDLVRIRLKWSRLTQNSNPITILENLPNLLELQLLDAYVGNQLEFRAGKFMKLKILDFENMEQLTMIIIDKGGLPCLQKLIMKKCKNLTQIPVGIDNLLKLKELLLYDLSQDFVYPLRQNGGMRHLVQHIPKIYSFSLQENKQWAGEDMS